MRTYIMRFGVHTSLKLRGIFSFLLLLSTMTVSAQEAYSNRYAMKLQMEPDSSFSLVNARKYRRFVDDRDVSKLPDVFVPYKHVNSRLSSKDYGGVRTQDIVYKTCGDYELVLTVDFAGSPTPAPFMIYVHGGGWSRGNNGSSRSLSQFLAKQKGITGVRVSYTLSPQPNATVNVSIQDIKDALKYVQEHAEELNVNPDVYGFLGTSAGAHLAGVGAMSCGARVFVGYSGIYDLETAAIVMKSRDGERVSYFCERDSKVLREASPYNLIPKENIPATMLVCGTYDVTVECEQSMDFARKLKKRGGVCDLHVYKYYDHNVSSKTSDKMEEIFFNTVDFITEHLK